MPNRMWVCCLAEWSSVLVGIGAVPGCMAIYTQTTFELFVADARAALTCALVQKSGGGMHTASTSLWDPNTDGANLTN
eukprot:3055261-Pyramimonas_sp.AAC.4